MTSKFKIVHFDSTNNSNYNFSQNSYAFDSNTIHKAPNSFNMNFTLSSPISNVKSIGLRSVELQNSYYNIRSTSFNNMIQMTIDGEVTVSQISIADGLYTNINDIITAINAQFTAVYPSMGFSFSLGSDNRITASSTNAIYSTLYVRVGPQNSGTPQYLAQMLGFCGLAGAVGGTVLDTRSGSGPYLCKACNPYSLSMDTYINMNINNLSLTTSNNNGIQSTFKISNSSGLNEILYLNEINYQIIHLDSPTTLSNINVSLTDKYGYNLNSNRLQWSFSLVFFFT